LCWLCALPLPLLGTIASIIRQAVMMIFANAAHGALVQTVKAQWKTVRMVNMIAL
jgi:hypothetical protein